MQSHLSYLGIPFPLHSAGCKVVSDMSHVSHRFEDAKTKEYEQVAIRHGLAPTALLPSSRQPLAHEANWDGHVQHALAALAR